MEIVEKPKRNEQIKQFLIFSIFSALILSIKPGYTGIENPLIFFLLVVIFAGIREIGRIKIAEKFSMYPVLRNWYPGLILGFLLAYFGFKLIPFIAIFSPYAFGRWKFKIKEKTIEEIGIISFLTLLIPLTFSIIFKILSLDILFQVNFFLLVSNLIPYFKLDGENIVKWGFDKWAFLILILIFIYLL
ncbi:MAG: hypothetical protein B6U78_01840 [Candidatus Aenigmarchaeota archaeon ex4484_224]|nr:MAG: hypothetical protein B6U78_01840 [Candidatus Aenigmarchaeota archaeon ex4484_224]